jgi:transcriptional regulator with XRE-family HTH domain
MKFAERLKKARQNKGLSQTELGEAVGIHYTQIGRYENKGATPTADILAKIANVLGVSSDYLMSGTAEDIANDTLKDKELLNQFKLIEQLPDNDRNVVKIFLDAFITKKQIQKLAH